MMKILKISKNNDYLKYYIRFLKEKKLYTKDKKEKYIEEDRCKIYKSLHACRKKIKTNSLMYNIEIPNMLISTSVAFCDFLNTYNEYNRNIAPSITWQIINKLCRIYNIKLTNNEKKEKQKLLVKFFKTKLFFNSMTDQNFIPMDNLITKLFNKTKTLFDVKITRDVMENIMMNTINNKIIAL